MIALKFVIRDLTTTIALAMVFRFPNLNLAKCSIKHCRESYRSLKILGYSFLNPGREATSPPGSLFLPSQGKKRDPGNEVGRAERF